MLGQSARAEAESGDFVQEVMVEVVRGIERFEPRDERSFLRWITQIARNSVRAAGGRRRAAAPPPSPS